MTGRTGEDGFSLIEVLIAITMISVGILALMQTAGSTTVMLRDGRLRTSASTIAQSRLDSLRLVAVSTTPTCTAVTGGSANHIGGTTEAWTVTGAGRTRSVTETVNVLGGRRQIGQVTVRATLLCP